MSEKTLKAFCWRTGLLQTGNEVPEGALELASAPESVLTNVLLAECRHGYNDELLVPGIPEAASSDNAVDAAIDFSQRLQKSISRELINYGGSHETAPCL